MHASSDITRLYLPRRNGGRGLINITGHYKNAIINFNSYILKSEEHLLKTASDWQLTQGDKSIHARASRYWNELDLNFEEIRMATKQQRKASIKNSRTRILNDEFSRKQTHGQLMRYQMSHTLIEIHQYLGWSLRHWREVQKRPFVKYKNKQSRRDTFKNMYTIHLIATYANSAKMRRKQSTTSSAAVKHLHLLNISKDMTTYANMFMHFFCININ